MRFGGLFCFVLRQSYSVVQTNLKLTAILLPGKSWDHKMCLANTYIFEVYFRAKPKQYLLITFNKLLDNSRVKQLTIFKSINLRECCQPYWSKQGIVRKWMPECC